MLVSSNNNEFNENLSNDLKKKLFENFVTTPVVEPGTTK